MVIEQILPLLPNIIASMIALVVAFVTTLMFFGSLDDDPRMDRLKTNYELAREYKSWKMAIESVGCALCTVGILWWQLGTPYILVHLSIGWIVFVLIIFRQTKDFLKEHYGVYY